VKLTKSAIDRLVYRNTGNSQDIRWDDALPGFGVRVYPTGKKSFVLSYRVNGRKHLMVVGRYGITTLNEARKKAKQILADECSPSAEVGQFGAFE